MSASLPPQTIAVGAVTDVGAVAQALASIFKMGDDIFNVLNSPIMLEARKNADVQAVLLRWDQNLKEAQTTGNLTTVDKESSG